MTTALILAVGLGLLGLVTGALQLRGLRRLAARRHVPSDEFAYLKARHHRRLLTAGILIVVGGLIAGAYLSGMERRADALGEPRDVAAGPGDVKPPMPEEDKQFVRFWGLYWIVVIVLVFSLVVLALRDAWATRRYWTAQLRALREDHNAKLRRDLTVYWTQRKSRGGRLGGRLGGGEPTDPSPS